MTTDSSSDYIKQGNTTFDTTSDNALKSINNGTMVFNQENGIGNTK